MYLVSMWHLFSYKDLNLINYDIFFVGPPPSLANVSEGRKELMLLEILLRFRALCSLT